MSNEQLPAPRPLSRIGSVLDYLRTTYNGAGPVLSAVLLAAALTVICWSKLTRNQFYPDPVAGRIAWFDQDKVQDTRALMLFVGVVAIGSVGIAAVCRAVAPQGFESDTGRAVNQLLLLCLIPAGWRLGAAFADPDPPLLPPLRTLAVFPLAAVICLAAVARFRGSVRPVHVLHGIGSVLLTLLFAPLSALAVVVAVGRLVPPAGPAIAHAAPILCGVFLGLAAAGSGYALLFSDNVETFTRRSLTNLMLSQLPLPLLLFHLVPPPVIDPLHRFPNHYPAALVAVLVVFCVIGWETMRRRFRSLTPTDPAPLTRAVAPAAVAGLTLFAFCFTMGVPVLNTDYFHAGEQLLPWQQLWDFGRLPYTDFVPLHGLMAFFRGACADVFFDGSAASFADCNSILLGIAAVATAFAASSLITPVGAMLLLLGAVNYMDRVYFVAPALFLIAAPGLLKRPTVLLAAWIVGVPFLSVYNVALGPAFGLVTLPVAVWAAVRVYKQDWRNLAAIAAAVVVVAAALAAVPFTRHTAAAFVAFVTQNAWTNDVAHGIVWSEGFGPRNPVADLERGIVSLPGLGQREWFTGVATSQIFWETFRYGWLAVSILSAGWFLREVAKPAPDRRATAVVFSLVVPAFFMCTAPWTIGRIDIGNLSRPGWVSFVAVFLVLPALVVVMTSPATRPGVLLAVMTGLGFLHPSPMTELDPGRLLARATDSRVISELVPVTDGTKLGFDRMGQAVNTDPLFLSELARYQRMLGRYLAKDETFLDLTNHTALYFFIGRKFPVRYPAFVAANSKLQSGMLAQLKKEPVPAVLVAPTTDFDTIRSSLRCYGLYRYFVPNFVAVSENLHSANPRVRDVVLLVDPARVPGHDPIGSEPQLKLLDSVFAHEDLQRLCVAWGQSWPGMKSEFTHVASVDPGTALSTEHLRTVSAGWYQFDGGHNSVEYPIPANASAGDAADFLRLKLHFTYKSPGATKTAILLDPKIDAMSAEPKMVLQWLDAADKPVQAVYFDVRDGDVLVPLGSYPRWLLGHGFSRLYLGLMNPVCAKEMDVSEIEFLKFAPG